MTALQMIDVDTGDVLDTIRLVDGRIVSDTAAGRALFESKRTADTSDEHLFDAYTDWCDGVVALQPVPA
ncbi:hypothetical protein [Cryptosporangium arvum]|uniref:hypothetical protein n=1 Tax=Cryptosporangium arvum TaxID=80871 RepID=UPI0004AD4857|nr:hypothetical protein [Cryptosporangium arvum]